MAGVLDTVMTRQPQDRDDGCAEQALLRACGQRLRAARQARGWTLAELAEQAAVSVSALSALETGLQWVRIEKLLQIARALELPIPLLLTTEPTTPIERLTALLVCFPPATYDHLYQLLQTFLPAQQRHLIA